MESGSEMVFQLEDPTRPGEVLLELDATPAITGLKQAAMLRHSLEDFEPVLVWHARQENFSWDAIATAVGLAHRQVAWRKYSWVEACETPLDVEATWNTMKEAIAQSRRDAGAKRKAGSQ